MPTSSEKIDRLLREVTRLETIPNERTTYLTAEMGRLREDGRRLQLSSESQAAKLAAVEQRCAALEKLADRGWQGWLALIGAGLALLVALLKK